LSHLGELDDVIQHATEVNALPLEQISPWRSMRWP
jgi:hypothetical protein